MSHKKIGPLLAALLSLSLLLNGCSSWNQNTDSTTTNVSITSLIGDSQLPDEMETEDYTHLLDKISRKYVSFFADMEQAMDDLNLVTSTEDSAFHTKKAVKKQLALLEELKELEIEGPYEPVQQKLVQGLDEAIQSCTLSMELCHQALVDPSKITMDSEEYLQTNAAISDHAQAAQRYIKEALAQSEHIIPKKN